MKPFRKLLVLEAKNFFHHKSVLGAMLGLMIFGLYSFYHGSSVIGRQLDTISSIDTVQHNHLRQIAAEGKGKSIGTTAYYPFFYTANIPSPWAAFAIGQRDVNAFSLKVKILGIEGQLYDSELSNPLTLLVGNLDASFVFIFLFPLLIIAFTYNTISQEREHGVWKIVQTSTAHISKIIFLKLSVRLAAVIATSVLVFLASIVFLNLPLSVSTFQIGLTVASYHIFWFLLCTLTIALGRNSAFNATTLVSVWIFLCILFPGIANVIINEKIPVPEALETTVKQREGYHAKWDLPKQPTMETFYADYPQYRKYPIPENEYSPGWYYAMQYAGEVEARASAGMLFEKLAQRQALAQSIGRFNPVLAAQQMVNHIARTDLSDHIGYLSEVKRYHKKLREYFYPHIFENTATEDFDWNGYPRFEQKRHADDSGWPGVLPILIWCVLTGLVALPLLEINFIKNIGEQNA